jgi:hypothetical protein
MFDSQVLPIATYVSGDSAFCATALPVTTSQHMQHMPARTVIRFLWSCIILFTEHISEGEISSLTV